jgi:hypothetical protein
MKKLFPLLIAVVLFSSHDMFLKLDTYFLEPGTQATIQLFNGTFAKSENVITRNRMIDVSLVGNGNRTRVDTTQWSEQDNATLLSFKTGAPGTWVAGLSTRPNDIAMDAKAFNDYLAHDGITDMLDWRSANGALNKDAVEKYSKHVKTIFQVGDKKTTDWQAELGYPIEFIPLANPYDLKPGDKLPVKLLFAGKPLTNQIVTIDAASPPQDHGHEHAAADEHGHEHDAANGHSHEEGEEHTHAGGTQLRTDARGELTFPVDREGVWFLRTIHLVPSTEAGLTHESNWATLTFEVGHGHAHGAHDHASTDAHDHGDGAHSHADGTEHDHAHDDEGGVPAYVFWIGSLAVLGGLFFFFNRKD